MYACHLSRVCHEKGVAIIKGAVVQKGLETTVLKKLLKLSLNHIRNILTTKNTFYDDQS